MASAPSKPPKSKADTKSKSAPPPASSPLAAPPREAPKLEITSLLTRLGIPVVIIWVIALFIPHWSAKVVAGVLTMAAIGLVGFVLFFTRKTKRVQAIVGEAKTKEERKEAIEKLDRDFKKGDAAATFAKAQLVMHEDPRKALEVLETIELGKVMPNVADEARAQRAMLHLMLGEAQKARPLADAIDLSRQQDQKAKATVAAVVCEAWARTGQAKKALDILDLFDVNDPTLSDARPGLLRAQVFAYGAVDDLKKAKGAMHQLAKLDPRIVMGFAQKGVHPLLVQEAKKILERAGAIPKINVRGPMRG
jgi:hypothetical protein